MYYRVVRHLSLSDPCSVEECQLLRLCRSPYSITPTTVVTYGNIANIYFICDQPLYTDCAIINYKIYNETGLAEGRSDETGLAHGKSIIHNTEMDDWEDSLISITPCSLDFNFFIFQK